MDSVTTKWQQLSKTTWSKDHLVTITKICRHLSKRESRREEFVSFLEEVLTTACCAERFESLLKVEEFRIGMIYLKMKLKEYDEVYALIKKGVFSQLHHQVLLKVWDEAHYHVQEKVTGQKLTSQSRFKIRQKFLPPRSICPEGRKCRSFNKTVSWILYQWLEDNFEQPFLPKEAAKNLALQTGLTVKQVRGWMNNARRRCFKQTRKKKEVSLSSNLSNQSLHCRKASQSKSSTKYTSDLKRLPDSPGKLCNFFESKENRTFADTPLPLFIDSNDSVVDVPEILTEVTIRTNGMLSNVVKPSFEQSDKTIRVLTCNCEYSIPVTQPKGHPIVKQKNKYQEFLQDRSNSQSSALFQKSNIQTKTIDVHVIKKPDKIPKSILQVGPTVISGDKGDATTKHSYSSVHELAQVLSQNCEKKSILKSGRMVNILKHLNMGATPLANCVFPKKTTEKQFVTTAKEQCLLKMPSQQSLQQPCAEPKQALLNSREHTSEDWKDCDPQHAFFNCKTKNIPQIETFHKGTAPSTSHHPNVLQELAASSCLVKEHNIQPLLKVGQVANTLSLYKKRVVHSVNCTVPEETLAQEVHLEQMLSQQSPEPMRSSVASQKLTASKENCSSVREAPMPDQIDSDPQNAILDRSVMASEGNVFNKQIMASTTYRENTKTEDSASSSFLTEFTFQPLHIVDFQSANKRMSTASQGKGPQIPVTLDATLSPGKDLFTPHDENGPACARDQKGIAEDFQHIQVICNAVKTLYSL